MSATPHTLELHARAAQHVREIRRRCVGRQATSIGNAAELLRTMLEIVRAYCVEDLAVQRRADDAEDCLHAVLAAHDRAVDVERLLGALRALEQTITGGEEAPCDLPAGRTPTYADVHRTRADGNPSEPAPRS